MFAKTSILRLAISATAVLGVSALPYAVAQGRDSLGLEQAIALALENDEWLRANRLEELSLQEEAVYAGQLPDPQIRLGASNLPIDSFDLNQEEMTQFQVGLSQVFPPGDTLDLQAEQKRLQSEQYPFLRQDREASLALEVSQAWLDAFLAQGMIDLHLIHRGFIDQLVEAAEIRYTAAEGNLRQQDLVLAQVELIQVDDRLIDLRQELDEARRALAQWLPYEWAAREISEELPELEGPEPTPLADLDEAAGFFAAHPRVKAFDKRVEAALNEVELARQSYKPGFTLGAEYAHRLEGPGGLDRSDFFSLSLTFDLPLFTEKRQEPRVRAASLQASALQAERVLLIRELAADHQQAQVRLERLAERAALYEGEFTRRLDTLTEASMTAYAAGEADFDELIEAYIQRHEARIAQLEIAVERLKTIARLNYLTTGLENREVRP